MTYNKYVLILFVNNSSSKEIDIVPSSWLDHYKEYGGTGCKYMPESLLRNSKNCKLLQKMVKYCEKPDPAWPTFHVEIRGTAETIEEAEEKLLRLEKEPYAFSTDNEQSAKAKAAAVEKTFKLKSLLNDKSKLDNIFSQAALELADEPTEIPELKKSKSPKKCNKKIVKKPTKRLKKNSLDLSSISIGSSSSLSPPSSLHKSFKKLNNGSKKRKRISSPSTPPSPLSSSSSSSPSSSTKHRKSINPNLRNLNTTVAYNPSQHHNHDKSDTAEMNILATSSSSTKNTVSNDFLLECMKQNYNSLSKQFANLKGQIINISADVAQILTEIKKNNSTLLLDSNQTDLEGGHMVQKLEFPLSTIEDFDKFNEKLKDEKYKNKINKRLYFSLDGRSTITRNMGNIIRSYISRDVALSFVAVKSTSNKRVFKDTTFFTCIKTVVRQKFQNNQEIIPDIKLHRALSAVLNNAKDWDGHRVARMKKQSIKEDK